MADLRATARAAAKRHGIDPDLFERQINAESGFQTNVCSGKGACGVAQFMPQTAAGLGINPSDPVQSLNGAAKLMAGYVKKYGSYENALRAYNAGPGAIKASHGYAETNAYVEKIMRGSNPAAMKSAASRATSTTLTPGTETQVTPAHDVPDPREAVLQALSQPTPGGRLQPLPALGSQGVLGRAVYNLQSGNATKTIPTHVTMGKDAKIDVNSTQAPTGAVGRATGRVEPAGAGAKVIGLPHQGTHTLGNWQSDNAVDIAVPVGTPLKALQDGVVVKVKHGSQDGGRFAGDQVTIKGANGNEYFYAHGSKTNVKPGQRIKRGQVIGRSGSANGVAHLHFGQMKGDPRQHTG